MVIFSLLIKLKLLVIHQMGSINDLCLLKWQAMGINVHLKKFFVLKNPKDRLGATLAHWLAFLGKRFSVKEIGLLGNPTINFNDGDLYDYDIMWGRVWFIDDISQKDEYQNRRNILHNGATIGHVMAREGHRFTDEEIARLGNPVDTAG